MAYTAVVPGYYLVCYNATWNREDDCFAVVPGYYLVCYNYSDYEEAVALAVVPGYYLVCYNCDDDTCNDIKLQFPVITWYVIIAKGKTERPDVLQFPVITWYVIMV